MAKSNPKTSICRYYRRLLSKKGTTFYRRKPKTTTIMKPEDKKDIEAIERELHHDGQQVRMAVDPSKNYKL